MNQRQRSCASALVAAFCLPPSVEAQPPKITPQLKDYLTVVLDEEIKGSRHSAPTASIELSSAEPLLKLLELSNDTRARSWITNDSTTVRIVIKSIDFYDDSLAALRIHKYAPSTPRYRTDVPEVELIIHLVQRGDTWRMKSRVAERIRHSAIEPEHPSRAG